MDSTFPGRTRRAQVRLRYVLRVDTDTSAVEPVVTAAITADHVGAIVWFTADAVHDSILLDGGGLLGGPLMLAGGVAGGTSRHCGKFSRYDWI